MSRNEWRDAQRSPNLGVAAVVASQMSANLPLLAKYLECCNIFGN
jgi:hypothetical protein